MRHLFISLLFTIFFWSCTKRDNSSVNAPCDLYCTTVQGHVLTGNNEPVAGVFLEFRSESRPTLGLGQKTIRKIATAKTDNNGFYSFTFLLKQGEYGNTNKYLFLKIDYDRNRFLPIPWYDQFGTDEFIHVTEKRDTTLIMNYYFASKAELKLQLINFSPSSNADSFYVSRRYHDVGYNKEQVTSTQFLVATQLNNEKIIQAAGNQQNQIVIVRKINGVRTIADTLIIRQLIKLLHLR